MKHLLLTLAFFVTALAPVGCATQSSAQHHAPALGGPAARVVEFPISLSAGQPREVRALVDEPALKLVTIGLRAGTVLPQHHSEVPVTIVALQGRGTVVTGAERLHIDSTHAVVLGPRVPHTVEADASTDLVLLIHHLGRAEERHP